MTTTPPRPVDPRETARLVAWARRLATPGPVDPTDHAAYLAAKTDLITRLIHHQDQQ